MPSIRSREIFDKQVLDLLKQGKSDTEIAEILGKSIHSVGDSRRRNQIYKIATQGTYEETMTTVVIVEHKPKAHKYQDQFGKWWLDVSEFFGI